MKDKLFNKLCTMPQRGLKEYLIKRLNMQSGDGYCFKQGTFPVLLTAHMDTVHKKQVSNIKYYTDKVSGKIIATSSVGIGGDDRCGIYMALKILDKVNCSVLFCEDEEIGSVGAKKFVATELCKSLKGKFKYIIELDRANSNDAVFYDDDNKEFHEFVTKEFFREDWGTWSDICTLSPALEISSVNLSCGYYRQHTVNEYVVMEEMYRSIEETIKLLKRTDLEKEPYKFVEVKYYPTYSGLYGYGRGRSYWDDDYESDYYRGWLTNTKKEKSTQKVEEECVGLEVMLLGNKGEETVRSYGHSESEAWYNFFINNPDVCYNDIIDYSIF